MQPNGTQILRALLASLLALLSAGEARAQEGGIEVFAAGTLFDQGTRVSLTHIYRREEGLVSGTKRVTDPLDQELTRHLFVAGIDRGLLPDLTVSALFPFVDRDFDSLAGEIDTSGIGDVSLLAKYRVHKRDWPLGAFQVALIGGVELPTGETTERSGGARVAPGLQPGSGSWDPFGAVAANFNFDRLRFDAVLFYKLNTEGAQEHEAGDFLAVSADAAYRFYHAQYPGPSASARIGVQWRHEARDELAGTEVASSGSDELLLRLGLGWHPIPRIDLSASVEVPVYEDFRGTQLGLGIRSVVALGIRF